MTPEGTVDAGRPNGATCELAVVIATRNILGRDHHLRASLLSLLESDLDCRIVLVDDASSDRTAELLRSWRSISDAIVVAHLSVQAGPGAARNAGMSLARDCDFITFIDDDDAVNSRGLTQVVLGMKAINADVGAGLYLVVSEEDVTVSQEVHHRRGAKGIYGPLQREVALWRLVFRTSMLEQSGVTFPEWRYGEDLVFLNRIGYYAPSVACFPFHTYTYVRRTGSTSRRKGPTFEEGWQLLRDLWKVPARDGRLGLARLAWSVRICARVALNAVSR